MVGGCLTRGTYWYPIWSSYATGVIEDAGYQAKLVDTSAKEWGVPEVKKILMCSIRVSHDRVGKRKGPSFGRGCQHKRCAGKERDLR